MIGLNWIRKFKFEKNFYYHLQGHIMNVERFALFYAWQKALYET